MSHLRSFFRPLAVALSLAFVAAPLTALAAPPGAVHAGKRVEGKDGQKHFPMAAAEFEKHMDKRITKAREKLEKRMGKHNVPDAKRAEMRKRFEDNATALRAAVKRAGADGQVTAEEAKEVRERAREMHGKGKGKDKGREHKRDKREGKAA